MSRPGFRLLVCLLLLLAAACGGSEGRDSEQRARGSAATFGDGYGGVEDEVHSSEPPLAVPADAPLLAVLGDSLAAGLHLPPSQAWPAQLQRLLAGADLPVRLQNAGVSGDTTAGGRSRLAWILRSTPDVVLVELGANDGLRGQPLEQIEANLRAILQGVRAAGARPVLVGMQIPTNYGPVYTAGFAELYPRLAAELGVPLVADFLAGVGGVRAMNLPDGLHPTPAGHRRLAQNAFDVVAQVVRQVQAERGAPTRR